MPGLFCLDNYQPQTIRQDKMTPLSLPTAEHKILVASIKAPSKEKTGSLKNLFYFQRLWRKAKCFKLIIMLMVSGGVNEPNKTNRFTSNRKGGPFGIIIPSKQNEVLLRPI